MGGQVASLALYVDPIILVMEHALEFVEIFVYLFNDLNVLKDDKKLPSSI